MAASSFRADSADLTGSLLLNQEYRYGYFYGTAVIGEAPSLAGGLHLPFGYVNTERSGISDEVAYVAPMSGAIESLMVRFVSGTTSPDIGITANSIYDSVGGFTASFKSTSSRLATSGDIQESVKLSSGLSFDSGINFSFTDDNHFDPGDHIAIRLSSDSDVPSSNSLTTLYTAVIRYKLD